MNQDSPKVKICTNHLKYSIFNLEGGGEEGGGKNSGGTNLGGKSIIVEYHEPRWWIPSHDGGNPMELIVM